MTTLPAPSTRGRWLPAAVRRRPVLAASLVLLAWMALRVCSGADLYDGSHIVALALRLSQGDLLFTDEMNAQAVGSLLGAPFVWLYTHTVGTTAIVLAYRWFYLLVAYAVGVLCYRALRTVAGRLVSFTAMVPALVVTSYHVFGISYNTVPTLAMVLTTCCGVAALHGPREQARWWVIAPGLAIPFGAVSLQSLVPAIGLTALLLLGLLWFAGRRDAAAWFLGALAVTGLPLLGYFLAVIGWSTIKATVDYTVDYQALRSSPLERWTFTSRSWLAELIRPVRLPAVLLAVLAAIPKVPTKVRLWSAVAFPVVLAGTSLLALAVEHMNWMRYAGSIQLYTVWCMLALVAVDSWRRRDVVVRTLLALAAPTVLVGLPLVAATTYAGPWYGEFVPGSVAACIATTVGVARFVAAHGGARPLRSYAVISIAMVLITQGWTNFYSSGPFLSLTPAPRGPYTGLLSGGQELSHLRLVQDTVHEYVKPGDTLMVYGAVTGSWLVLASRADTNIIWLEDFGPVGQVSVDWLTRTKRLPDVVLVSTDAIQGDGLLAMQYRDPVMRYLRDRYTVAGGLEQFRPGQYRSQAGMVVLLKKPGVTP